MKGKYFANEDHIKYYKYLEDLRKSGVTNMYGAAPYLYGHFPDIEAIEDACCILAEWMENYSELADRFNWNSDDN